MQPEKLEEKKLDFMELFGDKITDMPTVENSLFTFMTYVQEQKSPEQKKALKEFLDTHQQAEQFMDLPLKEITEVIGEQYTVQEFLGEFGITLPEKPKEYSESFFIPRMELNTGDENYRNLKDFEEYLTMDTEVDLVDFNGIKDMKLSELAELLPDNNWQKARLSMLLKLANAKMINKVESQVSNMKEKSKKTAYNIYVWDHLPRKGSQPTATMILDYEYDSKKRDDLYDKIADSDYSNQRYFRKQKGA